MVALVSDVRKPATRSSRLATLVLGKDPVQRRAVKRLLVIMQAYSVIWLLLVVAIEMGLAPPIAWGLLVYGLLGQTIFFVLLRGGFTLGLADPLFCFPQVVFGMCSVVVAYAMIPFSQGLVLQVLFVLLLYDLHRLTVAQIGLISTGTVVLLFVAVAAGWASRPDGVELHQELLNISLVLLVIPLFSVVGRAVRQVHVNQIEKKLELDKALEDLRTLSQRDALTGAVNRRYMLELLNEEYKRHRRAGTPFCVAMLDIDWFKRINDTHGHAVGDQVLKQMADMVKAAVRDSDVVARWGGEEFVILFPVCSVAQASEILLKLQESVAQFGWADWAPGLSVSFSAGVVEHNRADTVEQSVGKADTAMYRAKQQGRARVEQG